MARKKQGYNARLDESMGGRSGRKSQSEKSRRDESTGMERSSGRRKYSAAGTMDRGMQMGGMAGGLPEEIQPDMSGVESQLGTLGAEMETLQETDPRLGIAKRAYDFEQTPEGAKFKEYMNRIHRAGAARNTKPTAPMVGRGNLRRGKDAYNYGNLPPRGYRTGGMATMPSSNTTIKGPYNGKATSKNTNMHKLNAMGKLKGQ